jgi:hypothetical protein
MGKYGNGHGMYSTAIVTKLISAGKNTCVSLWHKVAFLNYVDSLFAIFDHLPPSVDIFYLTYCPKLNMKEEKPSQ